MKVPTNPAHEPQTGTKNRLRLTFYNFLVRKSEGVAREENPDIQQLFLLFYLCWETQLKFYTFSFTGPNVWGLLLKTPSSRRTEGLLPWFNLQFSSAVYPFCNKTLWFTFRVAPPGGHRRHFLCVCMRCFQTVAYLISCLAWFTGFIKTSKKQTKK